MAPIKILFVDVFDTDINTDIFVNCNWVDTRWQQYSTVQYTFTHKQ